MVNARPTVERRQLGLTLKRCRERAGLSQLDAGQHVGLDDSRISKVEDGFATLSADKLELLIDFYQVTTDERETIVALGAESRKRAPRHSYTDVLPGSFQRFADLEADAVKIHSYESGVVPGLLQSPGYINAVFETAESVWWQPSEPIREQRTAFRHQRQQNTLESKKSKQLHFIIGEAALTEIAGSPDVMVEQCEHLLSIIDSRTDTTIQLLPFSVPDNPARGGGLTVLEFGLAVPRVGFASVVHGPSTYYDEGERTGVMIRTFQRLGEIALSPEDTHTAINRKREEF
ncbi:MAG: helix-turn-helix domain-containing protein [Acidobacteria bacterium]|nr:helix-turn-helix domain-containing protein [Acidobacteriota bacterium]